MKSNILIGFLCLCICSCLFSPDKAVNTASPKAFDESNNQFIFKKGDSRLIARDFVFHGSTVQYLVPSIALFDVFGDTIISGVAGQAVSVSFWEYSKDTVLEFHWKQFVSSQDSSTSVYELKGGNSTPLFYGLLKQAALDTDQFVDREMKILFPLVLGKQWTMRQLDDPAYYASLTKKYLGKESIALGGVQYDCGKFEQHFLTNVVGHSWVSSEGLIKADIDYGKTEWVDSKGAFIDSSHTIENYWLLKINPNASDVVIAKAAAKKRYIKTNI